MVKIYNRKYNDAPPGAIYVGRPTPYGNRYTHLQNQKTLASVVVEDLRESLKRYLDDLLEIFIDESRFDAFAQPLIDKDLVCWCAPPGGVVAALNTDVICHAQILGFMVEIHRGLKQSVDAAKINALLHNVAAQEMKTLFQEIDTDNDF